MVVYVLLAVLLFLRPTSSRPHHWTPQTYPNPRIDPQQCGPVNSSWLCDPDGVITADSANAIDAIIRKVSTGAKPYAQAACGSSGLVGFPVGVAVMHRMYDSDDPATAAKDFAHALQDAWAIGDPACDNGVVIFLSVLQDQFIIVTGVGVPPYMPADVVASIVKDVRMDLAEGRYGAALEEAVNKVGLAIAQGLQPHDPPQEHHHHMHVGILIEELLVVFGVLSATVGALYQRRRRLMRGRNLYQECCACLAGIERDHLAGLRAGRDGAVNATTCPLCCAHLNPDGTASEPPLDPNAEGSGGNVTSGRPSHAGTLSDEDEEQGLRQPLNAPDDTQSVGVGCAAVPLVAVMLPCSHAFCAPCIAKRLEVGDVRCPICSRPIDDNSTDAGAASAGAATAAAVTAAVTYPASASDVGAAGSSATLRRLRELWTERQGVRQSRPEVLRPELVERLQRLQRMYPRFITTDMTATWERDIWAGRDFDSQQLRVFEQRAPGGFDGLLGGWRELRHAATRLQGLRLWRSRR